MTKVFVVFYSMYGHVFQMAEAIGVGACLVPDTQVTLYQVPELVPADKLEASGAKGAKEKFPEPPHPS